MRVALRADASLAIGTGHVMRCRSLAQALVQRGHAVTFICRAFEGHLGAMLGQAGFDVRMLPGDPALDVLDQPFAARAAQADAQATRDALGGVVDWLVVDHYGLDASWARAMRPACRRILALDDGSSTRELDCDLLLDQNLGASAAPYAGRVPPHAQLLLGPRWALLRPEFAQLRAASVERRRAGALRVLLVFFGGGDVGAEVLRALEAARASAIPWERVDVVAGAHTGADASVLAAVAAWPTARLHVQTDRMAQLMADADFALTAGGSVSWEKCCLGLPSAVTPLSDNQLPLAGALQASGAAVVVQDDEAERARSYEAVLRTRDARSLATMAASAAAICDGTGAFETVRIMEANLQAKEESRA